MATAEFSITGSVSGFSPFSDRGKDLSSGETVTLQLENAGTVSQVRFDIELKSTEEVPDIVLSPASGVPATPDGVVTFTAPIDVTASYIIRCIIGDGIKEPNWTKKRLVAFRSPRGTRHVVVTERDEYEALGWAPAINEVSDLAVEAISGEITGPGASSTGEIATWQGTDGNQLNRNTLAKIPPGTGQLQLTERIELGPSPSQQDGLNLSNGQGVYFRTIAGVGYMRGLGIDASDDLFIGDVDNDGSIILRVKGTETVDVEVGGVRKLRVDNLTVKTPSRLIIEPSGFQAATSGDIGLSKSGNIVGRNDAEDDNVGMLSLAGDAVTLGSAATVATAMATAPAGQLLLLTGITQALKVTSSAVSVGATPAPSGTLALPKTASINASNQGESASVPMIATDSGDKLLLGGNVAANKGIQLDVQTGYSVATVVNGVTELLVEAGQVSVTNDLEVQGGVVWPCLEPQTLLYTTQRSTTNTDLEDVTGASTTVTLPADCRVIAEMTCETSATTTSCLGGWAIEIDGVDGEPMRRYLSGSNDTGSVSVMAWRDLTAGGPYTIQARHQRVSGAGTVNTDKVQLVVRSYIKPA